MSKKLNAKSIRDIVKANNEKLSMKSILEIMQLAPASASKGKAKPKVIKFEKTYTKKTAKHDINTKQIILEKSLISQLVHNLKSTTKTSINEMIAQLKKGEIKEIKIPQATYTLKKEKEVK